MADFKMTQHMHREIQSIKKKLLLEATMVEENLRDAMRALMHRDHDLAKAVIAKDPAVDELEVEVEEDCLKVFALYQPVAVDLRHLVAFLKLNNDLERIGDLATNIGYRAASLSLKSDVDIPEEIPLMADLVENMLKRSLDALIELDSETARQVLQDDDDIDAIHSKMYRIIGDRIAAHPDRVDVCMEVLAVSRYLERVADHCTNIAEDVEYLLSGEIKRHHAPSN